MFKSNLEKFIVLLFSLFILSSCFSLGSNFPTRTDWIHKTKTSQMDVRKVLGTPSAVGNSSGVETWVYSFYKYQMVKDINYKELKFYWNPDGTVEHFNMTSSFPADLAIADRKLSLLQQNNKHKGTLR